MCMHVCYYMHAGKINFNLMQTFRSYFASQQVYRHDVIGILFVTTGLLFSKGHLSLNKYPSKKMCHRKRHYIVNNCKVWFTSSCDLIIILKFTLSMVFTLFMVTVVWIIINK